MYIEAGEREETVADAANDIALMANIAVLKSKWPEHAFTTFRSLPIGSRFMVIPGKDGTKGFQDGFRKIAETELHGMHVNSHQTLQLKSVMVNAHHVCRSADSAISYHFFDKDTIVACDV